MSVIIMIAGILSLPLLTGCSRNESTSGFPWFDRDAASVNVRSVNLFGYSTEGGVVRYYHRDGEVKMIDATFYGEMGFTRTQYLRDDRTILICDSTIHYVRPIYLETDLSPDILRVEVRSRQFDDVAEIPDSSDMGGLYLELMEIFESGVDVVYR